MDSTTPSSSAWCQQFPGHQPRERAAVGGQGRDRQIGVSVSDLARRAAADLGHQEDLRPERGIAGGQPGQGWGQQPCGGPAERGDPQRAGQGLSSGMARFGAEQVELPQDVPGVDEGHLPRRGRAGTGAAALEQDGTGLALAFTDGAGHRGLREAQGTGGSGEAASGFYSEQQLQFLRAQRARAAA
jgi:hypothetical protein